ncbi:ABC transporter permease [Acuticoccus sp. MNP-M23]|uniref:ABC transporter permease n=1 Tax=Acuticoccus sp. MNP-M23 TaxID=3072793 RepID=UPI0028169669|nr:ABC transporter permease [Acuticoccus sp. MNP-M23]WMS44723.1 ABC transporter permease [Acuticoccus sp. MNP-M23]
MLDALTLERRVAVAPLTHVAVYVLSLAVAGALALGVLVAVGVPTDALLDELVVQVFLSENGLAKTITIATPLMLVGLAAALTLRLRFWNIGIEGQLLIGAIAATAVALGDIGGPLRLPVMLVAAALGGALWIAIPLVLRMALGVSEVVVSLLLSNVAFLLLQHLLFGAFGDPARQFPTSPVFDDLEKLPRLGLGDMHFGLVIALIAIVLAAIFVARSRPGFYAAFVADNPLAARTMGFPVQAVLIGSVLVGGAMAGLAGGIIVSGTEHRLTQFVGLNATFSGIVIAAIARYRPLWIVPAAIFIAGLNVASQSLKVFYGVSEGVVLLIQGIVLLVLVTGQFGAAFKISRTKAA